MDWWVIGDGFVIQNKIKEGSLCRVLQVKLSNVIMQSAGPHQMPAHAVELRNNEPTHMIFKKAHIWDTLCEENGT